MGKGLQTLNQQNRLSIWAKRISECRSSGQSVKSWCEQNGIREQTYYKWQRKLFQMTQECQTSAFVEVTPVQPVCSTQISVTVRLTGVEAEIHSGADAATVETVLRVLRSC